MELRINGELRTVPDGLTVSDFLDHLGLPKTGVAVAIDRQVVPAAQWGETPLVAGTAVEVIRAVGGG